jgi:hypothetical protein
MRWKTFLSTGAFNLPPERDLSMHSYHSSPHSISDQPAPSAIPPRESAASRRREPQPPGHLAASETIGPAFRSCWRLNPLMACLFQPVRGGPRARRAPQRRIGCPCRSRRPFRKDHSHRTFPRNSVGFRLSACCPFPRIRTSRRTRRGSRSCLTGAMRLPTSPPCRTPGIERQGPPRPRGGLRGRRTSRFPHPPAPGSPEALEPSALFHPSPQHWVFQPIGRPCSTSLLAAPTPERQ